VRKQISSGKSGTDGLASSAGCSGLGARPCFGKGNEARLFLFLITPNVQL
jgi:hypothetical protein